MEFLEVPLTLIPTTKIQIFPICTPIVPQIFPTVAFTYCYHFPSTQTRAAYETHTRQIRAAKQFTVIFCYLNTRKTLQSALNFPFF